jgi:hypothetical protein
MVAQRVYGAKSANFWLVFAADLGIKHQTLQISDARGTRETTIRNRKKALQLYTTAASALTVTLGLIFDVSAILKRLEIESRPRQTFFQPPFHRAPTHLPLRRPTDRYTSPSPTLSQGCRQPRPAPPQPSPPLEPPSNLQPEIQPPPPVPTSPPQMIPPNSLVDAPPPNSPTLTVRLLLSPHQQLPSAPLHGFPSEK